MSPELISITVLIALFLIGTIRSVNMGVLGFVAAFAVGIPVVGMTNKEVIAGFPGELFLALLGLTFLFGFAQISGSIDLLVQWSLKLVRGKVAASPWVFFALATLLMSVGAVFSVAIIAPLAIPFARRYKINQLMMGMMVVHGALAGAFSPISVYGAFIDSYLTKAGLPTDPLVLFFAPLVFNTVVAAVLYFVMDGHKAKGLMINGKGLDKGVAASGGPAVATRNPGGASSHPSGGGVAVAAPTRPQADPGFRPSVSHPKPTLYQMVTLAALAALAVGTVAFDMDIGVLSMSLALVLAIINPPAAKNAMNKVSWPTAVLVCGILTFINVLQTAGTVEFVSSGISSIGIPLLAAMLLCYLAGVTSAVASSLGIISVAIALAVPFLESSTINPIAFVAALAIAATVVDVSPFSTNGALVLANVHEDDRDKFYRQMLGYAGIVVAAGPGLAWLAIMVPSSL
ncbi:SLC13 family permease [Arthrobacter sp. Y81]|uniref:SLC13 family permease n=1 Tax=Arthrobacter sp. Y81 TaxID=2058897 RepID=UPI000CE52EC4|nr:SLC13 family permease [Arthrobacter sp. Y81]